MGYCNSVNIGQEDGENIVNFQNSGNVSIISPFITFQLKNKRHCLYCIAEVYIASFLPSNIC
jgi:hypothetical protein